MFLKYLVEFAHSRKILNDLAFSLKSIRWIIPIDKEGNLVGVGLIENLDENGKRGKEYLAPKTSKDKGAGGIAEFLSDGITALFSQESEPDKKISEKQRREREQNNHKKYEHFWSQIQQSYNDTHHPALKAILNFHEKTKEAPPFLRWGVSQTERISEKPKWWVRLATGEEKPIKGDNLTFQVEEGLVLLDEDNIRPWWREIFKKETQDRESSSRKGVCLISGKENVPIAETHMPKIKNVPDTQSFGASIVSFDKPAFRSYGFEQSNNAPSSLDAVAAYTNALNWIINHDDHSLRIGSSILCFWAKEKKDFAPFVSRMLNRPDPKSVSEFLESPWAGIDRHVAQLDKFYSVTLSGNGGRVAVRHWMQSTVDQAVENFRKWFSDLEIVSLSFQDSSGEKRKGKRRQEESPVVKESKIPPLSIFRLACSTVREAKELKSGVLTDLYRAALEGTMLSTLFISPILHRLDSDLIKYGSKTLLNTSRFALLRLILNRNRKEGEPMIEPKIFETDDPAYNCGRLLAVLAEAQAKAHDYKLEGAGVAERYFGTASVSPSSVFPLLLRLNRHHLNKIRKSDRFRGDEQFIQKAMQDILVLFKPEGACQPPQFPRNLDLQSQGRFAIGFYQQKAHQEEARRNARAAKNQINDTNNQ